MLSGLAVPLLALTVGWQWAFATFAVVAALTSLWPFGGSGSTGGHPATGSPPSCGCRDESFFASAVNQPGYDIKARLHDITCPVLVTVGRHDWITPVEASERIVSRIPDARLVVFEKSGHSPQIEEGDLWLETVADFLHEVGADNTAGV